MQPDRERKIYKTFYLSTTIAIGLTLAGIFLTMVYRTSGLIHDELLAHARAHFSTIVKARIWNAGYGGVYVEKKRGVESNPHLASPNIRTVDGRVFTIRNPATMTRKISAIRDKDEKQFFRITSLKPVNPANNPDDFERAALNQFEQGVREFYREERVDGKDLFRYMAPLYVEKSCLACHASQRGIGSAISGAGSAFLLISKRCTRSSGRTIFLQLYSA